MTGQRAPPLESCRLYLIATVTAAAPEELARHLGNVESAVAGGADAVQLRLKGATTEERRDWLRLLRARLPRRVPILVNDDLDAVFDVDGGVLADGLHLGREDAARATATGSISAGLAQARRILGPDRLLGTSTRSLEEIRAALAAGVDHVGFGAMSASVTKADTHPASPTELARCVRELPDVAIFPIGGLGPDNLGPVLAAGCRRAAVGSAVLDSSDPERAARRIRRQLDEATSSATERSS